MIGLLLAAWLAQASSQPPAPPPDTEIILARLRVTASGLTIDQPVNISNSPGYDNQPSFVPDGSAVLFTSIRGGRQTDIYRYDIGGRTASRVTDTPESEYSPTVTPDGRHISVIRVEADSTQRLWQFSIDGRQPELVLKDVKPVGYHAWGDDHTLALFVLGQPATLQLADTTTGRAQMVARNIGRSVLKIPGRHAISFVERQEAEQGAAPTLTIRELDLTARQITRLVDAVPGVTEADCAWTPDGMLLMVKDDVLYGWKRGGNWNRLANLTSLGISGVTRIAISPKGDYIAMVTLQR